MSKIRGIPSQLLDLVVSGVEDQEAYKQYYNEECTKAIRGLLTRWVNKRIEESIQRTDDVKQLTTPSYSEMQAYQSGYRQSLSELKGLINRDIGIIER